jgi:1-phosphatidylinositol phosphodiesterase
MIFNLSGVADSIQYQRFLPLQSRITTPVPTMAWIARGQDASGLVQAAPLGSTPSVPAVATHRGELWCLWSDPSGDLYYAIGDNNVFQTRIQFPDRGIPVMAELTGMLYAIIIRDSGDMAHYVFDDAREQWTSPALLNRQVGFTSGTTPALIAFHNKLVLAFLQDSNLYYSTWTLNPRDEAATWKQPQEVNGIKEVGGIPALFVLDGKLHILCSANDENREILGFAYDSMADVWNSCGDVSEGKAAVGISATSYGESAFLAFQENGPDDESHSIFISEYEVGGWRPQEAVAGQTSFSPPQLVILNGRINCIFNANDETQALKWYSRSLLGYSLSTWMSHVPDDTLLSNITIPGTHDSCAKSNIPFVRTQYLSITKQMEAGIRFVDLRCRVDGAGELYMYHGGIPINMPRYLKFDTIMNEIFAFFQSQRPNPTETVLVSINNDDVSGKEPPEVFYNAVKAHIDATPTYEDGSSRWFTSNATAILREARGKAVLLRRYHPNPAISEEDRIGIDLSGWLNNDADFTLRTPSGVTVTLQDHWKYSEVIPLRALIDSKYIFVANMLQKAAASPPEHWFLNFMSAVGDPVDHGEIAESHWIAVGAHTKIVGEFVTGMNVSVRKRFGWDVKQKYGVIAIDYPELPKDSDLVSWLVGTNI